ncbi:MAG: type II toxin-antitoxin system VapB family antitoxin [Fimbriimonadaceae bacterium]|nr:type II toxin-antitoxin system VapB family antitoxin [Fimbriimonadaceae bacterium]
MALNIKNAEIHRMAHELARRTGKSLTQAVGDALRRELERAPRETPDRMTTALAELRKSLKRPLEDPGDLLFGEDGLPK